MNDYSSLPRVVVVVVVVECGQIIRKFMYHEHRSLYVEQDHLLWTQATLRGAHTEPIRSLTPCMRTDQLVVVCGLVTWAKVD